MAGPRRVSAEEAAALVKPGDWVDYGASFNQPDAFDRALAGRLEALGGGFNLRNCLSVRPRAVLEADPEGQRVACFNWHFSGYDRRKHDAGICRYIPCNLGEIPHYYRRFIERVDVAVLKAAPLKDGHFDLGPNSLWHRAVLERAKTVVIEEMPDMPRIHGTDNLVPAEAVDYVIAGDDAPTPELPNAEPTDVDRAVARLIAAEIEEGACLQVGIGGMPNAVCTLLLEAGVKHLGVHTEMLNDGIVELYRAGRVRGDEKVVDPGKITYTFALGSKTTYDTIRGNPDFLCHPVDFTNDPAVIARNPKAVAINNTTQLDLQGQASSESDGHRHISGTGGQLQFVRGAYASAGGKSFICLASTYERKGQRKSRIVLNLTAGNVVTTPRSDMMYVVTEYGIANLKGMSVTERAKAIIGLAHPDFREGLEREAREAGLIARAVF